MISIKTLLTKIGELRRNARCSRAELEALQLRKFRGLVRVAYQKSPYYRRIIKENRIDPAHCTPKDFPVLTKSCLLANFDEIATDRRVTMKAVKEFLAGSDDPNELFLNHFRVLHTSGSSGEVGYFVYSPEDWTRGIVQLARQLDRSSCRPLFHKRRVAYFGAVGGHFAGVSMISIVGNGLLNRLFDLSLSEVNSPLENVVSRLNNYQPTILSGYTSALIMLAEQQLQGKLRIAPTLVSSGGEAMSDEDRKLLENAFDCRVRNTYGASEFLVCGSSRPDGRTMQLYDDDLIFELHPDHSVITNLFNYTLPLIRYRTEDVFRIQPSAGGRNPYLVVDDIVGRREQLAVFTTESGGQDSISPFTVIEFFVSGVRRFQMRLLNDREFEFAVCLESGLDADARESVIAATKLRWREILADKAMSNVRFSVVIVDSIPVDPLTGKFRLIVNSPRNSTGSACSLGSDKASDWPVSAVSGRWQSQAVAEKESMK